MLDIRTESNAQIEPGHQYLLIPISDAGRWLARVLVGGDSKKLSECVDMMTNTWKIPHDHAVDQRLLELINELSDLRYKAPGLVQLTMQEGADV